jgi:membrane protein YdbS with pleckstrin-like domain
MSTPSRADRHTTRVAWVRRLRWLVACTVPLGLAAGVSLTLFAEERPLRVVGLVVVVLNLVNLVAIWVIFRAQRPLFRAQQPGREDR